MITPPTRRAWPTWHGSATTDPQSSAAPRAEFVLSPELNHPSRLPLAAEVHSRPFLSLDGPARISHLAIHRDPPAPGDTELIGALCARFGVAAPGSDAQHFVHDFGRFRLKWERHTEFSTFTFIEPGTANGEPFAAMPVRHLPRDWLIRLTGSILVAAHIVAERGNPITPGDARLGTLFPAPPRVGSRVLSGGELWTDFVVGADGFSRFLLRDTGLREQQLGRLVQRICEIETYRLMALLALPLARASAARLEALEEEVAQLGIRMQSLGAHGGDDRLLEEIARLAGQVRSLSFENGYRISAAQAYYRIVRARVAEMREKRIEGVPTVGEFLERRLAPAMDTCASVAARQEALAGKIGRSSDLLRTRVGIQQARQTQAVLERLSRSAQMQVRLQHAVEGLSVFAISYYGLSLAAYALKALKGAGAGINPDLATGALLPVALAATWWTLRRVHRRLHGD